MGDLHDAVKEYIAAVDSGSWSTEVDALDALRVAASADTDWRDRPPTEAEVHAHAAANPNDVGMGLWMKRTSRLTHPFLVILAPHDTTWLAGYHTLGQWRPFTAGGDPCAWPEVTP